MLYTGEIELGTLRILQHGQYEAKCPACKWQTRSRSLEHLAKAYEHHYYTTHIE